MSFLPAVSILAVLEAFSALKLDVARVRREAGIGDLEDPEALVPVSLFEEVVRAARTQAPREELVLEAGLAMPLGAFGMMDYLAASSDTVGEAFTSLQRFLPAVAPGCVFEIEESAREYAIVLRTGREYEKGTDGDEFTLGIMLRHFRTFAESFPLHAVDLSRSPPEAPEPFRRLFGVPVRFGLSSSALRLAPETPRIALKSRDPLLRRTLETAAARLGLGAAAPPLEMVIRGRLRELLPEGKAEAAHVAQSLALSTRSLHRKLAEIGRTFHDIVSDFRRAEAERLLSLGSASLTDVALRLGFADQSAFSRAFKRWTELSPSEWRSTHAQVSKSKRARMRPEEPT